MTDIQVSLRSPNSTDNSRSKLGNSFEQHSPRTSAYWSCMKSSNQGEKENQEVNWVSLQRNLEKITLSTGGTTRLERNLSGNSNAWVMSEKHLKTELLKPNILTFIKSLTPTHYTTVKKKKKNAKCSQELSVVHYWDTAWGSSKLAISIKQWKRWRATQEMLLTCQLFEEWLPNWRVYFPDVPAYMHCSANCSHPGMWLGDIWHLWAKLIQQVKTSLSTPPLVSQCEGLWALGW